LLIRHDRRHHKVIGQGGAHEAAEELQHGNHDETQPGVEGGDARVELLQVGVNGRVARAPDNAALKIVGLDQVVDEKSASLREDVEIDRVEDVGTGHIGEEVFQFKPRSVVVASLGVASLHIAVVNGCLESGKVSVVGLQEFLVGDAEAAKGFIVGDNDDVVKSDAHVKLEQITSLSDGVGESSLRVF